MSKPKRLANRLIVWQIAATGVLSLLALVFVSMLLAFSIALAGVIVVVANGIFALCLFPRTQTLAGPQVMLRFYGGEVIKLLVSAVCIAWVIMNLKIVVLPFLLTYFVLQMLVWPVGMMGTSRSEQLT